MYRIAFASLTAALVTVGCQTSGNDEPASQQASQQASPSPQGAAHPHQLTGVARELGRATITAGSATDGAVRHHALKWGADGAGVGLKLPGYDQVAEGPSATAPMPGGAILVLDRLNGRVLRVGVEGGISQFALLSPDFEDLATAGDSVVAYSRLQATAQFFSPSGGDAGRLTHSRALQQVIHAETNGHQHLLLRTAYQELVDVGSPAAPLDLRSAMTQKTEGAARISAKQGVQVRVVEGKGYLDVIETRDGRSQRAASFDLPQTVSAARIAGTHQGVVCMRTESVTATPEVEVSRRALCVDTSSGQITLDQNLPPAGTYLPFRELAMANGFLTFMHPTADGLDLTTWVVSPEKGGSQ